MTTADKVIKTTVGLLELGEAAAVMTPFSICNLASASVIASVVTTSSSRDTVCDYRVLPLRLILG